MVGEYDEGGTNNTHELTFVLLSKKNEWGRVKRQIVYSILGLCDPVDGVGGSNYLVAPG